MDILLFFMAVFFGLFIFAPYLFLVPVLIFWDFVAGVIDSRKPLQEEESIQHFVYINGDKVTLDDAIKRLCNSSTKGLFK